MSVNLISDEIQCAVRDRRFYFLQRSRYGFGAGMATYDVKVAHLSGESSNNFLTALEDLEAALAEDAQCLNPPLSCS